MELHEATAAGATDLHYVDMELYDTPEYGAAYILDADQPAVIETGLGASYDRVLAGLDQLGIAPEALAAIVVTHVHLDHAGGAGFLAEACPNATVHVPAPGAQFLIDPAPLWAGTQAVIGDRLHHYVEPRPVPADQVAELDAGDRVDLGDHALVAHPAPGHAFHQAALYDPATDGVFPGDAAGIVTPALDGPQHATPPPDFDLEQAIADVAMLRELDPAALYYTHFGDTEPDGLLEAYVSVLESWVSAIEQARATHSDDAAVKAAFADQADTVEAWGDHHARAEERLNVAGVLEYLDEE